MNVSTYARLDEVRLATENIGNIKQLISIILIGWPDIQDKVSVVAKFCYYLNYDFRDILGF